MSAVVLFVEIDTVPGQRDAFLARVREHRGNVIKNEPGCQRFDISVPDDGDDKVRLYEVYADQAAFDLHMETAYMKEYRADTGLMVANRLLTKAELAND
jgi:quinol monooxygenase YgiN